MRYGVGVILVQDELLVLMVDIVKHENIIYLDLSQHEKCKSFTFPGLIV
jgi:hypothetical protein